MKMVSKASKSALWTVSILLVTTNIIFAAPSNNNDESSGSRGFLKFTGNSAAAPGGFDVGNSAPVPLGFDVLSGEPDNELQVSVPYQDKPMLPAVRQPTLENTILNYLFEKHLMALLNSKTRSRFSTWDGSSNEVSRKRSYSKYCAFNAVSCFG